MSPSPQVMGLLHVNVREAHSMFLAVHFALKAFHLRELIYADIKHGAHTPPYSCHRDLPLSILSCLV